jgi:hypothetical protein
VIVSITAENASELRHNLHNKIDGGKFAMKIAFTGLAAASAFALLADTALAQSSTGSMAQQGGTMSGPSSGMGKTMHHMDSATGNMHSMPATVTSVDQKTGLIDVNSEGMALRLHFPPASLANIKSGDKITLKMGFSKS